MDIRERVVFHDPAVWESEWNRKLRSSEGRSRFGAGPTELHHQAAGFVGGSLRRHNFRLFTNGGLPLLERRVGPLIEEILIRLCPNGYSDDYLRASIQLHVSHSGIKSVRERYWRPASRTPVVLAAGDLGELEVVPCKVIWNLAAIPDVYDSLVDWSERLVLPWLAAFEAPDLFEELVRGKGISLVDEQIALEYILAEFGPREARRHLREFMLMDLRLKEPFEREYAHLIAFPARSFESATPAQRIAAIAHAYSLL